MKQLTYLSLTAIAMLLFACGGGQSRIDKIKEQSQVEPADPYERWETNFGVGPIKEFELPAEIDGAMAQKGLEVYEAKCTACHKAEKRFIGPAPSNLTLSNPIAFGWFPAMMYLKPVCCTPLKS